MLIPYLPWSTIWLFRTERRDKSLKKIYSRVNMKWHWGGRSPFSIMTQSIQPRQSWSSFRTSIWLSYKADKWTDLKMVAQSHKACQEDWNTLHLFYVPEWEELVETYTGTFNYCQRTFYKELNYGCEYFWKREISFFFV